MGWLIFALPVGALSFLIIALVLNALRQYLIARSYAKQKEKQKKKKYTRNDVLRRST